MERKKTIFLRRIILIIGLIILSPFSSALAQPVEITVSLDQKPLETSIIAYMEKGQLFVPARDIIEALGGRITWFPALKLLNLHLHSQKFSLVVDDPNLEIEGETIPLEIPARLVDNRVMLPLEVLKIVTQAEIKWDSQTEVLSINTVRPYLLSIRSYSHPDKTRIVIDLSESTEFRASILTNPDRILVDIMGSIVKLEKAFREIAINDGVVKTVVTDQLNEEVVKMVVDLSQKLNYEVFSLSNPERIVLDVFKPEGEKGKIILPATPPPPSPPAPPEKKPVVVEPQVTAGRVVIIDPGHGGSDPWAIGPTGLKEKEVTLGIALHLEKLLKAAGIPTYLTRNKDEFIYLEDRVSFANQKGGFVFVSIHANSVVNHRPSAQGIETFVLSSKYIGASAKDVADRENRASRAHPELDSDLAKIIADLEESANIKNSLDFAEVVQKKLVNYLKLEDRGRVKQAPFVVLKGVNMAAALIEVAFISNPAEEKLLKDDGFRKKTAQALFEAIEYYLKNTPEGV